MSTFTSFALSPELQRGVAEMGFTQPTPIQEDAIPPALAGRDILACAMTGSGKTAAFVLPILEQLLQKKRRTTRALILTPTRELAAQIKDHIVALAKHTKISGAAVFGGVAIGPQEKAFRRGVDIIVATPGRLLDHFQYPYATLSGLEILVLDEADRMLDMGFLPDIRRVLNHLPKRNQTLFFSATLPAPIVALSKDMLNRPVAVNIERASAPAVGITQSVYPTRGDLKSALLLEMLSRGSIGTALVFTRTKHRANRLAKFLQTKGVSCERIHGNRTQNQRTEALAGFKSGRYQVLVATDIAARGIDVEALSHVVNFDVPNMPDSYIHRVGRTARAQMTGDALTFVSADEESDLRAIERALGKRLPRLKLEGFNYDTKRMGKSDFPRIEPSNGGRIARGGSEKRPQAGYPRSKSGKTRTSSNRTTRTRTIDAPLTTRPTGNGYGRRPRTETRNIRQRTKSVA